MSWITRISVSGIAVITAALVIILSAFSDKNYIIDSIKVGASAYITKDNDGVSLINVIRNVYSGGT